MIADWHAVHPVTRLRPKLELRSAVAHSCSGPHNSAVDVDAKRRIACLEVRAFVLRLCFGLWGFGHRSAPSCYCSLCVGVILDIVYMYIYIYVCIYIYICRNVRVLHQKTIGWLVAGPSLLLLVKLSACH